MKLKLSPFFRVHFVKWIGNSCSNTSLYLFRSSHRRCSVRKGVLRIFTKFTGNDLCRGLFFNRVAGHRPAALLKRRLWYRCFPMNFAKFVRTPFSQNTSGPLLLSVASQSQKNSVLETDLPNSCAYIVNLKNIKLMLT